MESKIHRICENHSQVDVPHKYQKEIDNISRNKNIILIKQIKQVKGCSIVVLDVKRYTEKYLNLLESGQFGKIEYKKLRPTGSTPGLFYGTAKLENYKVKKVLMN